jgi:hypothetical protein
MKEARLSMIHAPVSRNIVVGGKGTLIRLAFSSPALIPSGSPLPCSRNESKRVWPKRFLPAAGLTLLRYTSTKVWPEPQRRWFRRPNKLRRIHWLLTPSLLSSSPMPTSRPIPVCRARRLVERTPAEMHKPWTAP